MTWRLPHSACLCAGMCVCLGGSRQLSPDSACPTFNDRRVPSPLPGCLDAPLIGLTVDFTAGLQQPPGRAGTASPAFFPKPFKAPFNRGREEAFEWRRGVESQRGWKKKNRERLQQKGLSPKSLQDAFHWSRSS